MYNPDNQYRCTIIRGRAQKRIEDLLPFYAQIIDQLCPISKKDFNALFNDKISQHFFSCDYNKLNFENKKTVRNHATEMAQKMFCLCYEVEGYVEKSESCQLLLETGDLPAFFKNLCLNFQFPNATQKSYTILDKAKNNIKIKPLHFVVSLLDYADKYNVILSKQEIAYYVLNSLEVLQGNIDIRVVYEQIIKDRRGDVKKQRLVESRDMQHITEQLNLLKFANVIFIKKRGKEVCLNKKEQDIIDRFKKEINTPFFDIYSYYKDGEFNKSVENDWAKYYGAVRYDYSILETKMSALSNVTHKIDKVQSKSNDKLTTVQIGDMGEQYVFEMEKKRVGVYKDRLINKVQLLGKIRGLGYDISSIEAEGDEPEFDRYIEVKSTIRTTEPIIDKTWRDSVSLTTKEWTAAKQYKEFYNIYRVYFTPDKTTVYRINDPYAMYKNGTLEVYPTMYQVNISESNIKLYYNE